MYVMHNTFLSSTVCKFRVRVNPSEATSCANKNCPSHASVPSSSSSSLTASDLVRWESGEGPEDGEFRVMADFSLLLCLSDHTGELEGVWLGGQAARDFLDTSVSWYCIQWNPIYCGHHCMGNEILSSIEGCMALSQGRG